MWQRPKIKFAEITAPRCAVTYYGLSSGILCLRREKNSKFTSPFFISRSIKARRSIIRISNASGKQEEKEGGGEGEESKTRFHQRRMPFRIVVGDEPFGAARRTATSDPDPPVTRSGHPLDSLAGATREGPRRLERRGSPSERSEWARRSENL